MVAFKLQIIFNSSVHKAETYNNGMSFREKIAVRKFVDNNSTRINKLFSNLPLAHRVFTSNIFAPWFILLPSSSSLL